MTSRTAALFHHRREPAGSGACGSLQVDERDRDDCIRGLACRPENKGHTQREKEKEGCTRTTKTCQLSESTL